ncbi:hypothetical protein [Methylovirgula sp. 4M-Z18]|uniref:hypothetical protein n=1 Tax=Methylovirgula sp. 4M-Z18 TaxID=2293567 RepID=UPI000E2F828D|nr:hypothetical protein [Methylovirgula sp. 4M-Z18]RFB80994.1 hypothetical protein DYH55_05885 [Methylovirgula sp. 4M-Z18]
MKLLKALLLLVLFTLILLATYVIHVLFFKVNVVFYSAILDGFIAAFITCALTALLPHFKTYNGFEKTLFVAIWLLLGYCFAISVPTVIDRSLSFYILEKLQQRGGGILENRFADVFTKEYMVEDRLVDVRLTEQLESGTIEIKNGCVLLTPRGRFIATLSRAFRQNLLPKQRLLMGQYSDVLTDPFKDSTANVDYKCSGS